MQCFVRHEWQLVTRFKNCCSRIAITHLTALSTPAIYVTRAYVTPLTTHYSLATMLTVFYFASRDAHVRHLMVTMWSFFMYNIVNTATALVHCAETIYPSVHEDSVQFVHNEFRFQITVVEFVELLVYWKSCLWPGLLDRKIKNIWDIDVCIQIYEY